ncbi:MAG TPA: sigma-70 family RNA polymerase sigma factor [Kofleriaceae bacterium]|nr:sigma-70 family RNA polymerase sigma factor [Kofleriaceae bacterium]
MSESDRPPGPGLEAFDAVYEREFDYVWRTLGRLGVPPSDLADAAHEVFLVVFRRWKELDLDRGLRPWLFGVARRVAADARRKAANAPATSLDREPAAPDQPDHAERDLLWRALAELDEDRRVAVILHDLDGYTGAEIASMLDVPANTVHSRLRLARADLLAIVRRLRGGTR